jgi:hypothetical protein
MPNTVICGIDRSTHARAAARFADVAIRLDLVPPPNGWPQRRTARRCWSSAHVEKAQYARHFWGSVSGALTRARHVPSSPACSREPRALSSSASRKLVMPRSWQSLLGQ